MTFGQRRMHTWAAWGYLQATPSSSKQLAVQGAMPRSIPLIDRGQHEVLLASIKKLFRPRSSHPPHKQDGLHQEEPPTSPLPSGAPWVSPPNQVSCTLDHSANDPVHSFSSLHRPQKLVDKRVALDGKKALVCDPFVSAW